MDFVVSVIYKVSSVHHAAEFLTNVLGFYQQQILIDDLLIDNGSVAIRLEKESPPEQSDTGLHLELQTKDIKQTRQQILTRPDVQLLQDITQVSRTRCEAKVQGPYGITITLSQNYSEDDLGDIIPLPTSLIWEPEVEHCLQQMLLQIPLGFRDSARKRITERAEMITAEIGFITVHIDSAIQALTESTPDFQQQTMITTLQSLSIDPDKYFPKTMST